MGRGLRKRGGMFELRSALRTVSVCPRPRYFETLLVQQSLGEPWKSEENPLEQRMCANVMYKRLNLSEVISNTKILKETWDEESDPCLTG